jgi:pentatricopeptide repeat protein
MKTPRMIRNASATILERYLREGNYDEVIRVASELKAAKIVLDSMDWFEEHQKNKEL